MWMKTWMILSVGMMMAAGAVANPTEEILHNFCSPPHCIGGAHPIAALIADAAGNLYGTAGIGNHGWVFEVNRSTHQENAIYTFCSLPNCADGTYPYGGSTFDALGNLYGTTFSGGIGGRGGHGTVFELTPSNGGWTYNLLYSFTGGNDGGNPPGTLILDAAGNLYGTTQYGGAYNTGTVFELAHSSGGWTETVLYAFGLSGPNDGILPLAGVTFDGSGNLYGTTLAGGNYNNIEGFCSIGCGTVYELTHGNSGWTENILHAFCTDANCSDGNSPSDSLIFDSTGNLYGTTEFGGVGAISGGTAFELSPSNGSWTETVLESFCLDGKERCADGSQPIGSLALDAAGNLYGTTARGGIADCGTVFRLAFSNGNWVPRRFAFGSTDGCEPFAGVLLGSDSHSLYGTTPHGGSQGPSGNGVVYKIARDSLAWR